MDDLSNSYLAGRDKYPKTVVDVLNLVQNWKGQKNTSTTRYNDGVNFQTIGKEKDGNEFINVNRGGILHKKNGQPVKCFTCSGNHFKSDCPHKEEESAPEATNVTATTASNVSPSDESSAVASITGQNLLVTATVVGSTNVVTSITKDYNDDDDWGNFVYHWGAQFLSYGT